MREPQISPDGLEVRGLVVRFGARTVLRGLDLEVRRGSLTAVLGPSGCGKTTLLRAIAGFTPIAEGRIVLGGRVLAEGPSGLAPERRRVGIVPQEGALFPHLDVAGNIGFGLTKRAARAGAVERWLELVGLEGLGRARPHELSGGQQQRVALARALAAAPDLVLLDEPFSALDAGLRASLRRQVADALAAAGATALLVTHDQQEALTMADQVAVMFDGALAQVGPPEEVYERPRSLQVASFVGAANLLEGEVRGGAAWCALGRLALAAPAPDGPSVVLVRPHQVRAVSASAMSGASASSAASAGGPCGLVETVSYTGAYSAVEVRVADTLVSAHGTGRLSPGEPVRLEVAGAALAYPAPGRAS